jgi:hypothetical protein
MNRFLQPVSVHQAFDFVKLRRQFLYRVFMSTSQLIKQVFISFPKVFRLQKKGSWLMLALYLGLGLTLFLIIGTLLLKYQDTLKGLVLDYLFPQSWQSVSESLLSFLFESQARAVIVNGILSGSLVCASIFLFPVKEKYSAVFEKELGHPNGPPVEFPLWMQALEETRLFLFYLTAQMVIVWIGYYPYFWANITSIVLSYLFLFYTFGLDLISPTLQRHRIRYSLINKLLSRYGLVTLSFGALYSLPALLLSQWILSLEHLNLLQVSVTLFVINLLLIALAIPAGTLIASHLLPEVKRLSPVTTLTKRLGYTIGLFLLCGGLLLHTRLLQSMHHKSQILKAEYSVDWSSFRFDYSDLSQLLSGPTFGSVSFDLQITNPTEFDIAFENSTIRIFKEQQGISEIAMQGFTVPAGQSRPITLKLNAKSDFGQLRLANLSEGWRIEMAIELYPGIPFIIEVLGDNSSE